MGKIFDIARPRKIEAKPKTQAKSSRKPGKKASYLFLFFAICFSLALIGVFSEPKKSSESLVISKKPQEESTSFSSPNSTASQTTQGIKGQETKNTNVKDINKKEISIKVLNGSGKSNQATVTKDILEQDGFTISEIGTAKSNYNNTIIYYKSGKIAYAKLLEGYFSQDITSEEDNEITGQYDLVIVVGKNDI